MGENQQHECKQEERIRTLEKAQYGIDVYLKVIREDVAEIKQTLKVYPPPAQKEPEDKSKAWQPIVVELIKVIGYAILILGGIAGVTKLLK